MIWQIISAFLLRLREVYWRGVYRGYRARYQLDPAFRFNGASVQLYGMGVIRLGARSYVGELCTLQAGTGLTVTIGTDCSISHNVRIYTVTTSADHDPRIDSSTPISASVTIGDGVWVGANVYIGPGIEIGNNAVIGANSVVSHSIPADEIWGGVPARLIRRKRDA